MVKCCFVGCDNQADDIIVDSETLTELDVCKDCKLKVGIATH